MRVGDGEDKMQWASKAVSYSALAMGRAFGNESHLKEQAGGLRCSSGRQTSESSVSLIREGGDGFEPGIMCQGRVKPVLHRFLENQRWEKLLSHLSFLG